jgi:hypothetical protein
MAPATSEALPRTQNITDTVNWGAVVSGTVAAAALAFVLHSFAAAIGLSISSMAPTWRDASIALVVASGLYLLLSALVSYGFGAYIAGRMRSPLQGRTPAGAAYDDGVHGLLTWALATLLTAVLAVATVQTLPRLAAPSSGTAGPATSVAGENIIAYDLDRLFRGERRPQADMESIRAEAARILLTVSSHRGMQADDRAQLVRLVSSTTGLAQQDADRRVTEIAGQAKANIDRARRSAVLLAFMAGAAALVGAAAAWFAACAGGAHRDDPGSVPSFLDWAR